MSAPLLATKLFIPPPGKNLVDRPRLVKKLNECLNPSYRLALISAPAGFGKTTLVSTWASSLKSLESQTPPLIAWLSLDEGDDDPVIFWTYVISSLQTQQEGIGKQSLNLMRVTGLPDLNVSLVSLVNDLARLPNPFILILDDYHHVRNPAIHSSLSFFIEHVSAQFHVIVSSRTDPPLPLALLRGRGSLLEIRVADMRFAREEIAFFLNQTMDLGLTREDIDALSQRTEGWIVGLQMAALSMQEELDRHVFVTAFSGDNHYIADYLIEEVLQRQPVEYQQFLLQTSILDHLNAPLCDAVTGRQDSRAILNTLERANLFIVPLDNRRDWFRYHHLFADLLQRRLVLAEGEQALKKRQRSAVDWLAANGYLKLAAEYAIKYADYELASELILAASGQFFKNNDFNTLLYMAERLPERLISRNLPLTCLLAHAANATGHVQKVERFIQDAEDQLGVTIDEFIRQGNALDIPPLAKAGLIELGVISARAQVDTFNLARTFYLTEHLLPYLTPERDHEVFAFNVPSNLRGPMLFTRGLAQKLHGEAAQAVQTFTQSAAEGKRTNNLHIEMLSLGHLGDALALQGRLHDAQRTFQQTLTAPNEILQSTPFSGITLAGLGNLAYEWNELETAEKYLQAAIEKGMWWRNWETLLPAYTGMARIHASRGNWQAAFATVDDLLKNTQESCGIVQSSAGSLRALLDLRSGVVLAAERWAEAYEPERPCDYLVEWEADALVGCRVWIVRNQEERADKLLERIISEASGAGRYARVIEALCLQATLFDVSRREHEALAVLKSALEMAKPEGYVRTFVDEGERMAKLLKMAIEKDIDAEYSSHLLTAFSGSSLQSSAVKYIQQHKLALKAPLSEREIEVVQLIATGFSNKEIAQKLFISIRTVKYYTTNIYTKLEVNGRAHAAIKAKELGFLK